MNQPSAQRQDRTVLSILTKAEGYLSQKGCATPRLDAQVLLADVLNLDRLGLYLNHDRPLSEEELGRFRENVRRRGALEPVAYLVGVKEFWSLPFRVDSRVLIPRPDSETLLEAVLSNFDTAPPQRFVDVGTGSGCLACALASMFPKAHGMAIDIDESALALAKENAERLHLAGRLDFVAGDLLTPLGGERVDLICANLPYIPSADLQGLSPEVRCFEPVRALDGGSDGLELIRRLVQQAPQALNPGGFLLLEVGVGQAEQITSCCTSMGFAQVSIRKDLAGIDRVVVAKQKTDCSS